jgi:type II secretory pathway component PulF
MALELQPAVPAAPEPRGRAFDLKLPALGRRSVQDRDRTFFTEQLALLLETGANLYQALRLLRELTANPAMAAVVDQLLADVAEGRPFSQALAKHPRVFPPTYVNLVAASESGGFMHKILVELKAMEEKRAALKNTLVSALSYPAFLLLFSFAVVVFVLVAVFPKFDKLFASIHDQLPATTKLLMGTSDLLVDHWQYVLLATGGAAAAVARWVTSGTGRATIDRLLLRLPYVRNIFGELYIVQALRVISLSLANGVPMVETLRACQDVVQNTVFRAFLGGVEKLVQEGGGLARAFEQAPFVPAIAKAMIRTAEESGALAPVAARIAEYYEQELARRLKTISRLAEPIMLLVMGAVVGLLVSSLILPIFKLARAVS